MNSIPQIAKKKRYFLCHTVVRRCHPQYTAPLPCSCDFFRLRTLSHFAVKFISAFPRLLPVDSHLIPYMIYPFSRILSWGDKMKYEDPKMEAYFKSLPGAVRSYINQSGIDICSLGDLTLIGEHFANNQRDDTSATNQTS